MHNGQIEALLGSMSYHQLTRSTTVAGGFDSR